MLYQHWGSGIRGFDNLSNSSARTVVPDIAYIHPCKFHIVPAGREYGVSRVHPTKPSRETRLYVRYLGVCVLQGKTIQAVMGMEVK